MTLSRIFKNTVSSVNYHLRINKLLKSGREEGFRILLYHSISEASGEDVLNIRVTPKDFHEHMDFLHRENYRVYRLEELINLIKEKKDVPERAVAITFDDGYKDILENAVPVLRKFGFPATIFVTLGYADGRKNVIRNYWEKWGYLSWEELKQLAEFNIDVGSHSVSHQPLVGLTREILEKEIAGSKQELETKLGKTVKIFSYPHGSVNRCAKELVKEAGYDAACSSLSGKNDLGTDFFELKRIEINSRDTVFEFKKKLEGYYDWVAGFKMWSGIGVC